MSSVNLANDLIRRTALAFLIVLSGAAAAFAQTTTFTYQGRFTDTTAAQQPTNGTYTMTFRLFDAATGGNQIPDNATAVTSMVSVLNGIFTTRLDFGAAAFNTNGARYLEIQIGSTVLTPRQEITSTPFAMRSTNAATADRLSASCNGCVTNENIGTVDGAKITGSVANAATAQNSERLGGVTASNFVQSDSNIFVRNQTTAQTADINISGTGSIGGSVGIGTTATTTDALRVVGSTGGDFGGAGKNISLQGGGGGAGFNGTGGTGGSVTIIGGGGGSSNISGGTGGEIRLQSGGGGGVGGNGAGITLQGGNGTNGSSMTNGGSGTEIRIIGGGGGTGQLSRGGGNGASITLQPGIGGIAERTQFNGVSGNVILAPTNGNVGIGTTNPTAKLYVNGDTTVTGTLNATATNATNAVNAANASNADKLDNLDSSAFARTADTANFIRNQTAQQTGNFNISGSGTVGGDLTVNGTLNAVLGQEALTVYGTGGLTVTRTNPIYTLVPGLTQTINVPANSFPRIVISTDGGIRSNSTTSDGRSNVEVAIYIDGAIISSRQHQLSNDSIIPSVNNWALSYAQLLTPGSHTIEIRARSTSDGFLSNATVSGGGAGDNVLRGQLTITTIRR